MSESVIVTVTFTPLDGQRDSTITALSRGIPAVHDEAGCEYYALHDAPDGTLFMIEKWSSAAYLDAHAAGEPVARLDASLVGLLAEPPRVTRITPIPAGLENKGRL